MDNCYLCNADTDICPSGDRSDQFALFTSPLDYEAVLEAGGGRGDYLLPEGADRGKLVASSADRYAEWTARVKQ